MHTEEGAHCSGLDYKLNITEVIFMTDQITSGNIQISVLHGNYTPIAAITGLAPHSITDNIPKNHIIPSCIKI